MSEDSLGLFSDQKSASDDDSDICARVAEAEQANSLQEENAALEIRNSTLKSQFDQAIRLANQSKVLQSQLLQFKEEKRQLLDQNATLSAQVDVLSHTNNDLKQKIDEERQKAAEQITVREDFAMKEVNKTRRQMQSKIDELQSENQNLQQHVDEAMQQAKIDDARIQRLTEFLSHTFHIHFSSIDEVYDYLESKKPRMDVSKENNENQIDEMLNDIDNLQFKYKSERKKRKAFQKIIKSMSSELNEKTEMIKKQDQQFGKISSLENQVSQLQEEKELMVTDFEHQISLLTSKNKKLSDEIDRVNQIQIKKSAEIVKHIPVQVPLPTTQTSNSTQSVRKVYEPCSVCHLHEELSEANSVLIAQNESLKEAREKAIKELEEYQKKIPELEAKLNNAQNENFVLENKIKAQQLELSNTQSTINKLRNVQNNNELIKNENKTLKESKTKLEKEIQDIRTKNASLEAQNNILSQNLSSSKSTESKLTNEIHDLEEKIEASHQEFMRIQQIGKPKPELTAEDVLPSHCFKTVAFDEKLNLSIERISNTEALQPSTKIQTIYRTISSYFSDLIDEKEQQINQEIAHYNELDNQIQSFVTDLSILLPGNPIDSASIIETIKGLMKDSDKLNFQNNSQTKELKLIYSAFNFVEGNLQPQIEYRLQNIEAMANRIKSQQKKIKSLKRALLEISDQMEKCKEMDKQDKTLLNSQLEISKESYNESIKINSNLKIEINKLNASIREISAEYEETKRKLISEKNEAINKLTIEANDVVSGLNAKLFEMSSTNEDLRQQVSISEEKLSQLRKVYDSQALTINQLKEALSKQEMKYKAATSRLQEESNSEKARMCEQYKLEIENCNKAVKSYQTEIAQLNTNVEISKKKIEKQKVNINQLKESIAHSEQAFKFKENELQRAQQIMTLTNNAAISEAEAKFSAKFNEQLSKFENEKQRIFSFAAEKLASIFQTSQKIDESSFMKLITTASDLIQKYAKNDQTIRSIVGANPSQETDAAVAVAFTCH